VEISNKLISSPANAIRISYTNFHTSSFTLQLNALHSGGPLSKMQRTTCTAKPIAGPQKQDSQLES